MTKTIKATIINVIVALLITICFISVIFLFAGHKIDLGITLINKLTVNPEERKEEVVKIDLTTKTLEVYPEFGTKYATLEIPSIDVNLPVYFGDTLDVLKKGIGHSSGSYFPGEGGSIIFSGHNFSSF